MDSKRKRQEENNEDEDVITVTKCASIEVEGKQEEYLSLSTHLKDQEWKDILKEEFSKPYFKKLEKFLDDQINVLNFTIYPPLDSVFNVFNQCPLSKIKVVILGQDPYANANQAMGIAFSVPDGETIPPSLRNIYKEIASDVGCCKDPDTGNLTKWVKQGVFLFNTILTVKSREFNSHSQKGWESFSSRVLQIINYNCDFVVFMIWGASAREAAKGIDTKKHLVLNAAHPSPLSSSKFFGCKHFSKCNAALSKKGKKAIDWDI